MKALQRELDAFYKKVTGTDFNIREVTKGALTQARSQLKPKAFLELNENGCETFYEEAPYWVWKGHRLMAVDGTRLLLPRHKTIIEEFGEYGFGPNADSKRSIALASMLYDVLNLVTVDAQLAPYHYSERDLLNQHVPFLKQGDLLLLDRGYPSIAIFYLLRFMGVDFCVRMKEDWWLKVKDFAESGEKDCIVHFDLPKKDRKLFGENQEMIKTTVICRLICVTLENGEKEILCTSLTDKEKYVYDDFSDLYHLRWNEEEAYKLIKSQSRYGMLYREDCSGSETGFLCKDFCHDLLFNTGFPISGKGQKRIQ